MPAFAGVSANGKMVPKWIPDLTQQRASKWATEKGATKVTPLFRLRRPKSFKKPASFESEASQ